MLISKTYCEIRESGGKGPIVKELSRKGKATCPKISINLQLAQNRESWMRTRTIITRKICLKNVSIWAKKFVIGDRKKVVIGDRKKLIGKGDPGVCRGLAMKKKDWRIPPD